MIAAALWIFGIILFVAYTYRKFSSGLLTNADAMDYAQIARNMVNGHGYATSILRPLAVTGFAGPDSSGTAPDVSRAPLYPFVLMLAFLGHGRHGGDKIVLDVSLLLFFISIYCVYRLARTLFPAPQQAWIALLSVGAYGLGGEALGYAIAGLPVTLATIVVTVLMIALYRSAETPKRPATLRGALWVGALLGLCYLAQYSLLLLALPVLLYVFFSRAPQRAWAGLGACVLGFLLVAGPWMYRNFVVCHHDPFFTLLLYGIMADTPAYPGYTSIYRSVSPPSGPLVYSYMHAVDVFARDGRGLTTYRDNLLSGFNFFLLAAATVSLFWRSPDARLNGLRACAAAGLAFVVLGTAVFQPSAQMIAPFAPLITVVAVGYVFALVFQQSWEPFLQRAAIWGLGLVIGLSGIVQSFAQQPPTPNPIANGLKALSDQGLAPNEAVMTDSPWETAWHIGLPSIWLPTDNDAYQAVESACARSNISVAAILLTPQIGNFDIPDNEGLSWALLLRDPNAFTESQSVDSNFARIAADAKANGPIAREYIAKYHTTDSYLIRWATFKENSNDTQFTNNFGSIAQILNDFAPQPSVQETASDQNSTLFLRRSGT